MTLFWSKPLFLKQFSVQEAMQETLEVVCIWKMAGILPVVSLLHKSVAHSLDVLLNSRDSFIVWVCNTILIQLSILESWYAHGHIEVCFPWNKILVVYLKILPTVLEMKEVLQ